MLSALQYKSVFYISLIEIINLIEIFQVGGNITKNALSTLCRFLCHRMIWLRKTVALRLTEAVMMYADVCGLTEESEERIMNILTEFDWENTPIEEIRKVRNELCTLFDVPNPSTIQEIN